MLDWFNSSAVAVVLAPYLYILFFLALALVINLVRLCFKRPSVWPDWEKGGALPRWKSAPDPPSPPQDDQPRTRRSDPR